MDKQEILLCKLQELSLYDADMIDSDDFEIHGETESGLEGVCTVSIVKTSQEAFELIEQLQRERDELKALADERKQFIVNAVDLGYCSLPDESTNDPATATFDRCLLTDSYAAGELQAKAVEDAIESLDDDCDDIVRTIEELYAYAATIRAKEG